MQYKNLGRSGLKVSLLSYGAWVSFGYQVGFKEAGSLLQCCRDHGVNFFDNAEIFLNGRAEEIMGQAIRELGWKRSDIVIATKIFWGGRGPNDQGLSRKHIVEGTKASLTRLDMDYVDILYCHRPDTATPIEETVRAMNYVIDHGWALYWGTSEWSAQQITEAWAVAQRLDLVGPIVEQPKYNLFHRHKVEVEYQPLYSNYGLGLTTWSPLASGVLTGKYNKGTIPLDSRFALENYKNLASRTLVDDVLRKVDNLKPIADELGVPLSQLAIAWCASNPNVSSVITGATKESQILENMKAIDVIPLLTPQVVEKIEAVVQSKPQCAKLYSSDDDQYEPINIASDVAKRIDLEVPNLVLRQLPFERATTVTIGPVTMPIIVSSTISCVASTAPGVQASIFKDATIPAMVSSGTVSMSGPNHAPCTSGTKIFEEWRTCTEVDRIASARRIMQSSFDFLLQLLDAGRLEMAFNMINLVTDSIAICRDAKLDISEIEATFLQIYNIVEELRQIVTVPAAAYYAYQLEKPVEEVDAVVTEPEGQQRSYMERKEFTVISIDEATQDLDRTRIRIAEHQWAIVELEAKMVDQPAAVNSAQLEVELASHKLERVVESLVARRIRREALQKTIESLSRGDDGAMLDVNIRTKNFQGQAVERVRTKVPDLAHSIRGWLGSKYIILFIFLRCFLTFYSRLGTSKVCTFCDIVRFSLEFFSFMNNVRIIHTSLCQHRCWDPLHCN